jgi:hypothetical protein
MVRSKNEAASSVVEFATRWGEGGQSRGLEAEGPALAF